MWMNLKLCINFVFLQEIPRLPLTERVLWDWKLCSVHAQCKWGVYITITQQHIIKLKGYDFDNFSLGNVIVCNCVSVFRAANCNFLLCFDSNVRYMRLMFLNHLTELKHNISDGSFKMVYLMVMIHMPLQPLPSPPLPLLLMISFYNASILPATHHVTFHLTNMCQHSVCPPRSQSLSSWSTP